MKKREKTIFRKILAPLVSVLMLEIAFMISSIFFSGAIKKLDQNAVDMLTQQTENRGSYLLAEMIDRWSNLSSLSAEINSKVQVRLDAGDITLDELSQNSYASAELLKSISPFLISTMYSKKISGIFVIFNTQRSAHETAPGVWLRDLDPKSVPSGRSNDLLWERAPGELVKSSYIATDTAWKPSFSNQDIEREFFRKPYQTAFFDGCRLDEKDYGYWTTKPYTLEGDSRTAVSYSIPLILEDKTVYGVLGIELLTDYIQSLLPNEELLENRQGSYILAVDFGDDRQLTPIVLSSDTLNMNEVENMRLSLLESASADESNAAYSAGRDYYAAAKRFKLYKNNAPFDKDKWYLLGISSNESLFAFSSQIQKLLYITAILTFVIGFTGILIASYVISKPIKRLSMEVEAAQTDNTLPVLSSTGIYEIDRFADSISRLGHEVVESSTRFLSILEMASLQIAAYELHNETDSVYVTDNYFPLLGLYDIDAKSMTVNQFLELYGELHQSLEHADAQDGSTVYSVPQPDGSIRYLRSEHQLKGGRRIGIIEDVTASTLEKMRIRKERDSDLLTGLYARRGFTKEIGRLFIKPARLKHAGLLMIDLDNLKTTNDRFGHEFGDLYIRTAGRCFSKNTPENTLCARMSGDEFVVFFYGYDSRNEIRQRVEALYKAIREVDFVLPNGKNMGLSASGGIAWYPEDSTDQTELMKYADFAMYQVKRSQKGEYKEFDAEIYKQSQQQNQA